MDNGQPILNNGQTILKCRVYKSKPDILNFSQSAAFILFLFSNKEIQGTGYPALVGDPLYSTSNLLSKMSSTVYFHFGAKQKNCKNICKCVQDTLVEFCGPYKHPKPKSPKNIRFGDIGNDFLSKISIPKTPLSKITYSKMIEIDQFHA